LHFILREKHARKNAGCDKGFAGLTAPTSPDSGSKFHVPSANESLPRCYLNRVLAPEGELLSFAPPKASNQRKGGPIAAHVLRSSHLCPVGYLSGGRQNGLPAHLPPCGIHAAPLRAIPDKYCGARRGKREKSALLRNVSS